MRAPASPRWILSFADLCLLLLCFFVLLHAKQSDPRRVAAGMRAAFGGGDAVKPAETEYRATALFQPGEAVLTEVAARWLARLGSEAAKAGDDVLIVSDGIDPAGGRLDGWELAAARAAAVGRAIRAGGLGEAHVTISIPATGGAGHDARQTLRVTRIGRRG